jgi:Domain of unknown function (DUF4252)
MQDTPFQEPAVKLTHSLAAMAACVALAFPLTGSAAGPKLNIPDFSHLRSKAIDSVDITLDGMLLNLVKRFAAADQDGDDAALAILTDIKSLRVRNFEFDSDGAYSRADVDAVREQLSAPGWSALVQAHKRESQEDVDVFVNTDDGKIMGMAVVVSDPRSFTIVNIIGSIDIDKLAKIEGQFGIPRVSQVE